MLWRRRTRASLDERARSRRQGRQPRECGGRAQRRALTAVSTARTTAGRADSGRSGPIGFRPGTNGARSSHRWDNQFPRARYQPCRFRPLRLAEARPACGFHPPGPPTSHPGTRGRPFPRRRSCGLPAAPSRPLPARQATTPARGRAREATAGVGMPAGGAGSARQSAAGPSRRRQRRRCCPPRPLPDRGAGAPLAADFHARRQRQRHPGRAEPPRCRGGLPQHKGAGCVRRHGRCCPRSRSAATAVPSTRRTSAAGRPNVTATLPATTDHREPSSTWKLGVVFCGRPRPH